MREELARRWFNLPFGAQIGVPNLVLFGAIAIGLNIGCHLWPVLFRGGCLW